MALDTQDRPARASKLRSVARCRRAPGGFWDGGACRSEEAATKRGCVQVKRDGLVESSWHVQAEAAGACEVADISGLWREGKIVAAVGGLDCLDADERARFAMAVQRLTLGSSRTARLVSAVAAK